MSESKTKLSFRPGVISGEKSPPPTGLLINHGKPNFTISRTAKKTNAISSNDSQSEHFGTINRRAMLKKTPSNGGFKKEENEECIEFLQAHKKISEKIAKESNIHDSVETREEVNNNASTLRFRPAKEQNFVRIQNGKLNTAVVVNSNAQNGDVFPPKINGHLKPALPEKPVTLQNYKPTSPTGLSVNTNTTTYKNQTVSPSGGSPPVQNGVNFEQKTFVSFSKDLSSEPNKYPETVKITKPSEYTEAKDRVIEELAKLKFDIVSNGDVVTPVVRNQ